MELKDWLPLIPSTVQTVFVIVSVLWAVRLYHNQKRDAFEASNQLNRAHITEAYMRWHATILASDKNVDLASRLIRKSYKHIAADRGKISPEQAHAIHIYTCFSMLYI